jgi:hypothetical protein
MSLRRHGDLWRPAAVLAFIGLSGCVEVTSYDSPSASGVVIDAASEKPLAAATVSVKDHPGFFAQADAAGQFVLLPITRKTYIFALAPYESSTFSGTLIVSADGYASKEIVVQGRVNSLRVALQRVH